MKKLCFLIVLLCMICAGAVAEQPQGTATPAPTRVPAVLATPEGAVRATPTPRPTDAPLPEDPFMANAVELARRIDLLAKSSMFMITESWISLDEAEKLFGGDHTWPSQVFVLKQETLIEALFAGVPAENRPDFTRVEMRRDLVSELPYMLLGDMSQEQLSTIQTLHRYKVFACDDASGCGVMIMLYEDAAPIMLTWYADRGAVSISACFMPDEALRECATAEAVSRWFASRGMPEAAFEEVQQ